MAVYLWMQFRRRCWSTGDRILSQPPLSPSGPVSLYHHKCLVSLWTKFRWIWSRLPSQEWCIIRETYQADTWTSCPAFPVYSCSWEWYPIVFVPREVVILLQRVLSCKGDSSSSYPDSMSHFPDIDLKTYWAVTWASCLSSPEVCYQVVTQASCPTCPVCGVSLERLI